jgi:Fur family transcriptional regulator, zinc uptake regulator
MADASHTYFNCKDNDHQVCIKEALARAEQLCQRRKQRFTAIRRRVLKLIWQEHKAIGAYEMLAVLQKESQTAPPTVYRALDFLQQMGLVHRIASLKAFVGCAHPGEPHDGHFLICESCKTMIELDLPGINTAIEQSAEAAGFHPLRHTVEVLGFCPACRKESST